MQWLGIIVVIILICIYFLNSNYFLYTKKYVDFNKHMRHLWADHVIWTRQVIISDVDKDPMLSAHVDRLLKNASDMSMVVKHFYGKDAAAKAKDLLEQHLKIAIDLVNAAIASSDTATIFTNWQKNAEDIATFFDGAGAYYSKEMSLREMMLMHLDLTKQEAVDIIGKKSLPDTFDKIFMQAMDMAEGFSAGIMSKFWYRFVV